MRKRHRQDVTGLVVNQQVAVARPSLRRFRALLQQIEKDGPAGKRWGQSNDVLAAAHSYAYYVMMVNPDKGAALVARVQKIRQRYGHRFATNPYRKKANKPEDTSHAPAPTGKQQQVVLDSRCIIALPSAGLS